MTEDQIKAIAEEYAASDGTTNEIVADICEAFLYRLKDRYCIVEREKVIEVFTQNNYFAQHPSNPSDSYYQGVIDTLTRLFGTSMFNQNEE